MTQNARAALVVSGLFLCAAVTIATSFDTLGVFLLPLSKEFGWNRATASLIGSMLQLSSFIATPIAGLLIDRINTKRVMLTGVFSTAAAMFIASRAHSLGVLLVAYTFGGIGTAFCGIVPASFIISNWFSARRGTALGIAFSGYAFGEMVGNVGAGNVVAKYGWRAGYLTLAVSTTIILIPVVLFMIQSRPDQADLVPTGQEEAGKVAPKKDEGEFSVRGFVTIAGCYFIYALIMSVPLVHGVPFLVGLGYSQAFAATVWGIMLGCSLFGRASTGLLIDRVGPQTTLVINFLGLSAGLILLLYAAQFSAFLAFIVCMALLGFGAPVITALLQGRILGLKNFGIINGLINGAGSLGYATGPVLAGWAFDLTGSYSVPIKMAALTCGLGVIVAILIKRPQRRIEPALA